tara:strand:+ start:105 stop:332 length:228 start_codon:yes stop_codon:yes gene_type:complete
MDKQLHLYCTRALNQKILKFKNNKVMLYPREWFSELNEETQINIICICLKHLSKKKNLTQNEKGYMDDNNYKNFG